MIKYQKIVENNNKKYKELINETVIIDYLQETINSISSHTDNNNLIENRDLLLIEPEIKTIYCKNEYLSKLIGVNKRNLKLIERKYNVSLTILEDRLQDEKDLYTI